MASVEEQFNALAEQIKHLASKPADEELLTLYGLFKQATVGDVNTARPGMLDFKGKAKWDAWEKVKGVSKDNAMQQYIDQAKNMIAKYGTA